MLHSAIDSRVSADGSVDDHRQGYPRIDSSRGTQRYSNEGEPSAYVSVFDPVREPAFEPSRTKPLPKWMHLLPNNVHREREQRGSKDVEGEVSLTSDSAEAKDSNTVSVSSARLENQHQESSSATTTLKAQGDLPTPPLDVSIVRSRIRADSKLAFVPDPEVESIGDGNQRANRRSYTGESYTTAPENPRPKTPFPRLSRPSLPHRETSFYFSHRASVSEREAPFELEGDTCCNLGAELRVPTPTPEVASPTQVLSPPPCDRPISLATPTQSSEYLEKYRPLSATSPYSRYVPKDPEPIPSKLKRQRVGTMNLEQVADERRTKRPGGERATSPKLENEEYGLGPMRRDLDRELRNLFCEE